MGYLCLKCKAVKTEEEAIEMVKGKTRLNDKDRTIVEVPVHCNWKMVIIEDLK